MGIVVDRQFGKDIHLTGHVKVLGDKSSLWNGYLGKSSQPVRDLVLMQVIPVEGVRFTKKLQNEDILPESGRLCGELVSSLSVSCIEKELCTTCLVDQRTDKRPKDREHPVKQVFGVNLEQQQCLPDLGARMMRTLPRVSG